MTPSLRQMIFERNYERAATAERERILAIVSHPAAKGWRAAAIRLAAMPEMTVEVAAELLTTTATEVAL